MKLFNRHIYQLRQARAQKRLPTRDFLRNVIERDVKDRLLVVKRDFPNVLVIGQRISSDFLSFLKENKKAQHIDVVNFSGGAALPYYEGDSDVAILDMPDSEDETLPITQGKYDLVIEAGQGHHINDLPGWLIQGRLALKADGLFIAVMAGGETLSQLKSSLLAVETQISGGASPRVAPFAPLQSVAGLMQRAGFALPVVDSDTIPIYYRKLETLLYDLRAMGEASCLDTPLHIYRGKDFFDKVEGFYRQHFTAPDGTLKADFDLIYMHGWAPHESQQKPLRPGQGQTSLEEVL